MNREVQDKFVAALRSGLYEQTTGDLIAVHSEGERFAYCVMGVLCDVAVKEGAYSWPENIQDALWMGTPPEEVGSWAELPAYVQGEFIQLNDEFELTFEEFADLIDGHYDDLSAVLNARYDALTDIRDSEDADEDFWGYDDDDFVDAERPDGDDVEEEENA